MKNNKTSIKLPSNNINPLILRRRYIAAKNFSTLISINRRPSYLLWRNLVGSCLFDYQYYSFILKTTFTKRNNHSLPLLIWNPVKVRYFSADGKGNKLVINSNHNNLVFDESLKYTSKSNVFIKQQRRSFSTSGNNNIDNNNIDNNTDQKGLDSNYKLSLFLFTNIRNFLDSNPINELTQLEIEKFLLNQYKVWD